MRTKDHRRLARLLARLGASAMAAILVPAAAALTGANDPTSTKGPASTAAEPEATKQRPSSGEGLSAYVKEVEEIRSLSFTSSVAGTMQSPERFHRYIAESVEPDKPQDAAHEACAARALARLGLWPEGFGLGTASSRFQATRVIAYYDDKQKNFHVVRRHQTPVSIGESAVHELTHALQDQRFGLAEHWNTLRGVANDDAKNALRFLVEGEAEYVETLWTLRYYGRISQLTGHEARGEIDEQVAFAAWFGRRDLIGRMKMVENDEDPEAARATSEFLTYPDSVFRFFAEPYYAGQQAVHFVHSKGGWKAVDALWENPPSSTEQLLHPEKLLEKKRDEPVKVDLPDLSSAVGAGYTSACEETLGEFETRLLLEGIFPGSPSLAPAAAPPAASGKPKLVEVEMLPPGGAEAGAAADAKTKTESPSPAAKSKPEEPSPVEREKARHERAALAAAGWGGDRFRSFEKPGGGAVVVWKTIWDTVNDATEFDRELRSGFVVRLPKGSRLSPAAPAKGADAALLAAPVALWGSGGDPGAPALLAARSDREVIFIAGATTDQARSILAALHPSLAAAAGATNTPAQVPVATPAPSPLPAP